MKDDPVGDLLKASAEARGLLVAMLLTEKSRERFSGDQLDLIEEVVGKQKEAAFPDFPWQPIATAPRESTKLIDIWVVFEGRCWRCADCHLGDFGQDGMAWADPVTAWVAYDPSTEKALTRLKPQDGPIATYWMYALKGPEVK